jgi:hypothetical protein
MKFRYSVQSGFKVYFPKEAVITMEQHKKPNYLFYGTVIGEKLIDLVCNIDSDE